MIFLNVHFYRFFIFEFLIITHSLVNNDILYRYPGNLVYLYCNETSESSHCNTPEPPYQPYDEIHVSIDGIGLLIGRSMTYEPEITTSILSARRYVNIFLGVPYAQPPIGELRFRKPMNLHNGWGRGNRIWDASYFRSACPYDTNFFADRFTLKRNISEDCLHLNIFSPNFTDYTFINKKYAVLIVLESIFHKISDPILWPGHILARNEIVVVTLSYRVGALGYLSTQDENSRGNYGLYDVIKALEFIKKYIRLFNGDDTKITLAGSGSASCVVSTLIKHRPDLMNKAILMGGSDNCIWSKGGENSKDLYKHFNDSYYAHELGRHVGCYIRNDISPKQLIHCLKYKHFNDIVAAQNQVEPKTHFYSIPFGPNIKEFEKSLESKTYSVKNVTHLDDIIFTRTNRIVNDKHKRVKHSNHVNKIIIGLNKFQGAHVMERFLKMNVEWNTKMYFKNPEKHIGYYVTNPRLGTSNVTNFKSIHEIIEKGNVTDNDFKDIVRKYVRQRNESIYNLEQILPYVLYQYRFWTDRKDSNFRLKNLLYMFSDHLFGSCVQDTVLNMMENNNSVHYYVFNYSPFRFSWIDIIARTDMYYLFGYPMFNISTENQFYIKSIAKNFTKIDVKLSTLVQEMWANFTKFGEPTPLQKRFYNYNITWYSSILGNMSYLSIDDPNTRMFRDYRMNSYAMWNHLLKDIVVNSRLETTTKKPATQRIVIQTMLPVCLLLFITLTITFLVLMTIYNRYSYKI